MKGGRQMVKKLIVTVMCAAMLFSCAGCERDLEQENAGPKEKVSSVSDTEIKKAYPDTEKVTFYAEKAAYANWSEDSLISELCLNSEAVTEDAESHLPVFRFDSEEDIKRFREAFGTILTLDHGYNEMPSFDEVSAEYDGAFFETRSVLLIYVTSSSGSFRYGIDHIENDGTELRVFVVNTNAPETYTSDMAGWFLFVEAEKSALESVTSFDSILSSEEHPVYETLPGNITFGSFSYAEVRKKLEDLPEDSRPEVKTEGFVNTEKSEGFWPADRAKAELTGEFEFAQTFYDSDEDVWMVHFWNSGQDGEDVTVYMNGNGLTVLILYGE